jgi:hypothetical protein
MFLLHLIIAEKDTERLSKYNVTKPKHHIVSVPRNKLFQLTLCNNNGDVDHHQYERDEVYY